MIQPIVAAGQLMSENPFNKFLEKTLGSSDFKVFALAGDASTRKYYRVILASQPYVLMQWEPFDPKSYPFLSVLDHFHKNGVHVPKVIGLSANEGFVLLEDLGDLTLERKFWENQNEELSMPFYHQAIDELIKIHYTATSNKSDCTAFKIKFDTEKFLWELNYGKDNLIKGLLSFKLSALAETELTNTFTKICTRLDAEPKYIAHRDYHSRNIMLKLGKTYVIDFQDARMGPIQYDLVSLIKDSYVNISASMGQKLLEYYHAQAQLKNAAKVSLDHFNEIYELQSVQRCFKACGSFASFYMQRKDTRYLKYISPTLKTVLKSLKHFPEYKNFANILTDSGATEKKYEAL